MTCILTQRHMWSPLSIIALPGGDSRDLFSRHWHKYWYVPYAKYRSNLSRNIYKMPMVTDSLFFLSVCQLTPIFVCTVQLYHRWIMKLKSGGKHSIYHPATRNQSFHDFKSERKRIYIAKLHCFFILHTIGKLWVFTYIVLNPPALI